MTETLTTYVKGQKLIRGDCRDVLLSSDNVPEVDVIVTSPPYNLGKAYSFYADNGPRPNYLRDLVIVFARLRGTLKDEGSLFLNMGFTATDPLVDFEVLQVALQEGFTLQNRFAWVKSIAVPEIVGVRDGPGASHFEAGWETRGHFQPITSPRFVNLCWEHVFHLTKTGKVPVDRLALGVPYEDESNLKRGTRGKNGNIRCRGNTWFVPYETIDHKAQKGDHPAVFPVALAENCIRLHGLRDELVVLDPFMGTGTVLEACRRLGCRGIGIEVCEDYWKYAVERVGRE